MAGMLSLKRLYLSIYNWTLFFGWSTVLFLTIKNLKNSSYKQIYDAIETPLQFSQTAALMEIVHGAIGLVRSSVAVTLSQIGGRNYMIWIFLYSTPQNQNNFFVLSIALCWSIIEIIRYSFYGMKEAFGYAPSWLTWLRYNAFIVLYPIGFYSEAALIYNALPYIQEAQNFCIRMPNRWNFSFDDYYPAVIFLAGYPPAFPYLYSHMIGQRKKTLSKSKEE